MYMSECMYVICCFNHTTTNTNGHINVPTTFVNNSNLFAFEKETIFIMYELYVSS